MNINYEILNFIFGIILNNTYIVYIEKKNYLSILIFSKDRIYFPNSLTFMIDHVSSSLQLSNLLLGLYDFVSDSWSESRVGWNLPPTFRFSILRRKISISINIRCLLYVSCLYCWTAFSIMAFKRMSRSTQPLCLVSLIIFPNGDHTLNQKEWLIYSQSLYL